MNTQHKTNKLTNRLKRIHKRVKDLQNEIAVETKRAAEFNSEPVISVFLAQINRLKNRKTSIEYGFNDL